ncbi:ATP-binding protein [Candidatus Liberibacter sp.]|uniref:ATP-binding protein n=1 Tax=Candidatus Liberibacter sp. TaxID=34022 RepID=UPI0015F573B0|nr:ATP-binding protein [Candidatus Liberibacter sp.]MBA5724348.1 ATP-binding protein [Candidatus Liberibacter sp.]
MNTKNITEDKNIGIVISCSGALATITSRAQNTNWRVGCLVSIVVEKNLIIALINSIEILEKSVFLNPEETTLNHVELIGELSITDDDTCVFTRGISYYPPIGAKAYRIESSDMKAIYDSQSGTSCIIGKMSHDHNIEARINIKAILESNFAVVGSTGSGKSSASSLLLRKAVESNPNLRILMIDPHDEFSAAFSDISIKNTLQTIELPFWMMNFEEFSEVLFQGKEKIIAEMEMLYRLIIESKKIFHHDINALNKDIGNEHITVDTPIPYRISDLLSLIEKNIGKLEGRTERPFLKSLRLRILSIINDPLYQFMFSKNAIKDSLSEIISHIFRIPCDDKPISILELTEKSTIVTNCILSVLSRWLFDIASLSNKRLHFLIVCEEAHLYISNKCLTSACQSLSRIAKEGRKYGCSIGIITQQPSEIDKSILSQCSTVFALRLTSAVDHQIIYAAIPNSSLSKAEILSSIRNGEAVVFGAAITIPMKIIFSRIHNSQLPKYKENLISNIASSSDSLNAQDIVQGMRTKNVLK